MENQKNSIEVRNMSKDFKIQYDKAQSLKEMLLFWNREKPQIHHVLKDINLDIKKGDTVALIGTNGSGKSTLLKLMTKILYPTSGILETNGRIASLLELGAGFHPDFTGRENIYFNAAVFGLTRSDIDKRINDIIEFSELGDFINNPVRTYSSGMYMRLAFSIAINVDAEILLIDEILAVGDQHFQDKCFEKLIELRDSDKTIVIVSHSLDMIRKLCTRAVWIYKGQIKMDGNPEKIIDCYLEQVIKDHSKIAQVSNSSILNCKLTIEAPRDNADYKMCKNLLLQGWEVGNFVGEKLKYYVDDEFRGYLEMEKRNDVLMHFQETMGGASLNRKPGFKTRVDVEGLKGHHRISIEVVYENNIIAKETVHINLIEEK